MNQPTINYQQHTMSIHTDVAVAMPTEPPRAAVMALHGWAQSAATFLETLLPLLNRPIMLIVPQAPYMFHKGLGSKETVFHWNTSYQRDRTVADNNSYLASIWDTVGDQVIPLFLLGYSQGASVAYRCAVTDVVPLAGLIACCADFPEDVAEKSDQLGELPLLLVQGNDDKLFTPELQRLSEQRLQAGALPYDTHHYEGGHRLEPSALPVIGDWILAQAEGR